MDDHDREAIALLSKRLADNLTNQLLGTAELIYSLLQHDPAAVEFVDLKSLQFVDDLIKDIRAKRHL